MFSGNYVDAMSAVEGIEGLLDVDFLNSSTGLIDRGDAFWALRYHVWVRFGKWEDILRRPLPDDEAFFAVTTCTAHYARCLAHILSAEPNYEMGDQELSLFCQALSAVPESRRMDKNSCRDVLQISQLMLQAEFEWKVHSNPKGALQIFNNAVKLQACPPEGIIVYDEPWAFMQPVRHALVHCAWNRVGE